MKKYLMILSLLGFYFAGCSEETLVSSEPTVNQNNYKLIELPAAKGLKTNTVYTVSKEISGYNGGSLSIGDSYVGGSYGKVTKNITLTFPAGAYSGTKNITMTVDDYYCTADFSPSMSFLKSATVNATYTGIDLTGINVSTIKFVYLRDDGAYENLAYDGITVDYATGTISVKNVKINHFSRYGFVN